MRVRFLLTGLIALGLMASFGGCSGNLERPPMGKVRGKVTLNGQPLKSGTVTFTPITGKGAEGGNVATGELESDGTFVLTTFNTGDGAVVGQHAATVVARQGGSESLKDLNTPKGADMSKMHNIQPKYTLPKTATPSKYADPSTSGLKYTVTEGENEPIVIDLKE